MATALAVGLCAVAIGRTQQLPVFRGGTNLIVVDAYPRGKDGRIIEGLTPADFEVFEDGQRQTVEQFEFVRVEPVPENERHDPKTQTEMLQAAADPHNRVFVVYLDTYHVTMAGSKRMRFPLVTMLDRILGPADLFGMTTPKIPPSQLVLGRKLVSVESQLAQVAPWGERDTDSQEEQFFFDCYSLDPPTLESIPQEWRAYDGPVLRWMPHLLMDRWREDRTLQNLKGLVTHVGSLREARTVVMTVTDGWRLFRPDQTLAAQSAKLGAGPPAIGVPPRGGPIGPLGRGTNGRPASDKCRAELVRLAAINDERLFTEIVTLANRSNVVFYTISPDGLDTSDARLIETLVTPMTPDRVIGDMDHARSRFDAMVTLARETDGISVTVRGDRTVMNRIVNDVSAYYLLGYSSANPKADGKLRRIKVQVKQPNVAVVARRGYVVPTPESIAAKAAAKAKDAVVAPPPPPAAVTDALKVLARLGADMFAAARLDDRDLEIVTEIPAAAAALGKWRDGGSVAVTVTMADGAAAGSAAGRIGPGSRSTLVRVPVGSTTGPWRVIVKLTGKEGTFEDLLDVRAPASRLLNDPGIYRGSGSARTALVPAAEPVFNRTERLRAEIISTGALEQRAARLLDPRGRLVAVQPTLTERPGASGGTVLAVDLTLAPLAGGDYVLEVTAGRGAESEQRYVGFRVVR